MRNGNETVRLRRLRRAVAALALLTLLAGCSGASGRTEAAGAPTATCYPVPAADIGDPCLSPQQRAAPIKFRSGNGALLAGLPLGDGERGVVLAHVDDGTLCDWLPYGQYLAQRGFAVLDFDLDGHGLSQPADDFAETPTPDADVISAVRTMQQRGTHSVMVVGAAVGATAAVTAAAQLGTAVDGVVVIPGVADRDVLAAARRLRVPILCVAADDGSDLARDAHRLCDAASSSPSAKTLLVPDTSAYGQFLLLPNRGSPCR
jgi:pimeloyl-ACP methyl ester carboxylesterase